MARLRKSLALPVLFFLIVAVPLVASVISQTQGSVFTKHDLAYYLDEDLVNFVRPGIQLKIVSASVENSKLTVHFTLTDPKGLPLDKDGVTTPGAVTLRFVGAYIPKGESQYVSYVTRSVLNTVTNQNVTQATTDSNGTYVKNGDGDYTYTFGSTLPATYDATLTHTVGMTARRDLREFGLGLQVSNDVYTWVPNGSEVTVVRDVVRTENCNQCHNPLAAHGGSRTDTRLCILCHTPQSTDNRSTNTVDFKVMIHKIHMGENLPSVKAGTPFKVAGGDFSTVAFPNDVRNCDVCHKNATQGSAYLTNPSRAACGSCHDDVNFATGENHVDQPQVSDHLCSTCHIPQGDLEFDASILGAHTIPTKSAQLPGVKFEIQNVANTSAGQNPTVTFSVTNNNGDVVDATKMSNLSLVIAGPTSDYTFYASEDARSATASGGSFIYTMKYKIPDDAKGTFAIGIQGYNSVTLNPDTKQAIAGVRDAGFNQVTYFSVDGSPVTPRRKVVALDNCNKCHGTLALHGGSRRNTEFCVMCHNPNTQDTAYRPADKYPAESVNFKTLIHKIHTGEDLTTDFTVYGYHGSVNNFNEVRFPGDRRDCLKCHTATPAGAQGTYELPLPDTNIAQKADRDWLNPLNPVAGACLSCHTEKSAAAHASIMTSPTLGESCDVCHGTDADASVAKVHAR